METHKIQNCALWGVRMHVGQIRVKGVWFGGVESRVEACIQVGGAK